MTLEQAKNLAREMGRDDGDWLYQAVLRCNGTADNPVTFGNVQFWIDADGPWKGQLSYSTPVANWNREAITNDAVEAVTNER